MLIILNISQWAANLNPWKFQFSWNLPEPQLREAMWRLISPNTCHQVVGYCVSLHLADTLCLSSTNSGCSRSPVCTQFMSVGVLPRGLCWAADITGSSSGWTPSQSDTTAHRWVHVHVISLMAKLLLTSLGKSEYPVGTHPRFVLAAWWKIY